MAVTAQATAAEVTSWATAGTVVCQSCDMATSNGPNMLSAVKTAKTVPPIVIRNRGVLTGWVGSDEVGMARCDESRYQVAVDRARRSASGLMLSSLA